MRNKNINNISPDPPFRPSPSTSNLEFRSFWKAGAYDVRPTRPTLEQGQLEHARVHPKFLHSNATSHKWAFGAILAPACVAPVFLQPRTFVHGDKHYVLDNQQIARDFEKCLFTIAELLDNAVDEISKGATFVKLDKISNARDHNPALLFQDNGGGMDPESLRQCMSLGYSKKKENTIGQYGNGFKTSTMRLGADVIVFSRTTHGSRATQSIGLLSYTFLRKTGQDDVIVPMIDFELSGDRMQPIIYSSRDDWSNNLGIILEWSPFASEQELMLQLEDIGSHGTKIILYNLWLNDDGLLELDFDYDEEDIRLRDEVNHEKSGRNFDQLLESHISYRLRFSLRAYASILYLRKLKNFSIILRGKPVEQYNMVDDLNFLEVVMYRPQLGKASNEVSVKTEIGFVKEAPLLHISGFNVYHKNRLIRPFWRVISGGNSSGNGVVGILEANFIEPAHDKQDFERSALFLRLEMKLKQMCYDYWKRHFHLIVTTVARKIQERPTQPFNHNEADLQQKFACEQPVIGLSVHMQQGMHLDQPVVGLGAKIQNLSNGQSVHGHTSDVYSDFSYVQPMVGLAADSQIQAKARSTCNPRESGRYPGSSRDASVNWSGSALADQICEENIQLFTRCEDHRQKETELKQTIEALERELAEAKRKCSQLASHLESQKKARQLSGKVL